MELISFAGPSIAALNFVSRFATRRPTMSHQPIGRSSETSFKEKVVVNNLRNHPIEVLSVTLEIDGIEHRKWVGETLRAKDTLSVELSFSQQGFEDGIPYPTKLSASIREATRSKPTTISSKGQFLANDENRLKRGPRVRRF